MELYFFYKVIENKILDLYLQFGADWKDSLARISVESIKENTILFEAKQFFNERNHINDTLELKLQESINKNAMGTVKIGNFVKTKTALKLLIIILMMDLRTQSLVNLKKNIILDCMILEVK